jgi:predicted signal transduction protein with EAL and GGDEF domain
MGGGALMSGLSFQGTSSFICSASDGSSTAFMPGRGSVFGFSAAASGAGIVGAGNGSLEHHIGVGIGIALFPQDGPGEVEILRRADIALYRAKDERPKSVSRFFDADMDARTQERDLIERDLPGAIIKGDVRSYYQPLIDLQTKHVAGFEALARWQHAALGGVSPDRFIPVAESCGLMNELTDNSFLVMTAPRH